LAQKYKRLVKVWFRFHQVPRWGT